MATEAAPVAAPPVDNGAVVKASDAKPVKEKKVRAPRAAKGSKPPAAHPPYLQMVKEALVSLKERGGSSQYAIAKYIEGKYQLPPNFRKTLSIQLKNLTKSGKFVKVKNSFKLSDELKKPEKEVKKPVVKKVAKTSLKKPKSVLKKSPGAALKKAVKKVTGDARPKKVAAPKATSALKKRKAEAAPKAAAKKIDSKEKIAKKRKISTGAAAAPAKKVAAPKKVAGTVKKAVSKGSSAAPKKAASTAGKKATPVKKTAASRVSTTRTSRRK